MAPRKYEETTPELAAEIIESAQQLVRLEIALAKQEAKELAIRNGAAIGLLIVAVELATLALLVALPVLLVSLVRPLWLGALIWLVVYVVLAAGMALAGRSLLSLRPPPRTISSLKETKEWVLQQLSTNGK
jgi:putative superfamily III holin-X